jgi:hypothetical protein
MKTSASAGFLARIQIKHIQNTSPEYLFPLVLVVLPVACDSDAVAVCVNDVMYPTLAIVIITHYLPLYSTWYSSGTVVVETVVLWFFDVQVLYGQS